VAGKFTTFSGQSLYGVARLHGDPGGSTPTPPPPRLDVIHSPTGLILNWTGEFVLQHSTHVAGPYEDVPGSADPPCVIPTTQPCEFFRLRSD